MKWVACWWMAGLAAVVAAGPAERLVVCVGVHSEDPNHPDTPDFQADPAAYAAYRSGLLRFAGLMESNRLPWSLQSDWNFLRGVQQYEIAAPDTNLLAATAGTNVIRYLAARGVEMVPHSHEGGGYNYADVAWLLTEIGVEPEGVVGGHIYDPAEFTYQDWPRFIDGLGTQAITNGFVWRPYLLMGAGTPLHVAEPMVSGFWRPAGTNDFFTDQPTNRLACFGVWENSTQDLARLLRDIETGRLPTGRLYTAGHIFAHHTMTNDLPFATNIGPVVRALRTWRDAGRLEVVGFREAYRIWQEEYGAAASVVRDAGVTNELVTFSLNVQDFSYVSASADLLDRALTLHEQWGVPVDVFLTTWMVDYFSGDYPALWGRLLTSRVAALSYHTRAPLPYRTGYDWLGLSNMPPLVARDRIRAYESHGLILTNGQTNASAGGSSKLEALAGHAPWMVGAEADSNLATLVNGVFRDQGARFSVMHGPALNFGQTRDGLYLRPEHYDLRLFEWTGTPVAVIFTSAVAGARSAPGGVAPRVIGVKMHDNDFIATSSAWMTVYLPKQTPPWDTNRFAVLLPPAEASNMWSLYESAVTFVASNRYRFTPVHAPTLLNLEGEGLRLGTNTLAEGGVTGAVAGHLALVTTNTTTGVVFRLVGGPGDDDNAEFQIAGSNLLARAVADRETRSAYRVRVQAVDDQGRPWEQSLQVFVQNATDDDDDGDGLDEAAERVAGTDPRDAASALQWEAVAPAGGLWRVGWQAVSGRVYRVDLAAGPDGTWSEAAGGPWTATSAWQEIQLTVGTAAWARVRIEP